MTAETVCVDIIYTFHSEGADQQFQRMDVELIDGQLQEARLIRLLLSELGPNELVDICKISICLLCAEGQDGRAIAPWLLNKNSPFFMGKLYFMQHIYSPGATMPLENITAPST
jgi:hypothetical protein